MILNPFIIISPQTSPSRHHPKGLTDTDLTQRPLGRQHRRDHLLAGLLASGGVHEEILEEHLRIAGTRSATLGVVVALDVDGSGHRGERFAKSRSLAVRTGNAVALRFGSLNDELQVRDAVRNAGQREGHRRRSDCDGCIGRSHDTGKARNSGHDVAAAVNDPVVEPHKQVAAADLAFGAQHRAAFGGVGGGVPRQDLRVRQTLPGLAQLLEHGLHGGLVARAGASAVTTVADVLTALDLRCGHALGGARHLFKCDGGDVLHGK